MTQMLRPGSKDMFEKSHNTNEQNHQQHLKNKLLFPVPTVKKNCTSYETGRFHTCFQTGRPFC